MGDCNAQVLHHGITWKNMICGEREVGCVLVHQEEKTSSTPGRTVPSNGSIPIERRQDGLWRKLGLLYRCHANVFARAGEPRAHGCSAGCRCS